MKKLFVIILLMSCSHAPLEKLSEDTLKVVFSEESDTRASLYYKSNYQVSRGRFPAAVQSVQKGSSKEYVLALYNQYELINHVTASKTKKLHCPQFHHEVSSMSPAVQQLKFPNYKKQARGYQLPEKALLGGRELGKKSVIEALKKHNRQNRVELEQLCERGESTGLYAYLNSSQFYNLAQQSNDKNPLGKLLKIPVISNILLLNNLRDHVSDIELKALQGIDATWMQSYLKEVRFQ